jgi:excisionase family DNA binding protein
MSPPDKRDGKDPKPARGRITAGQTTPGTLKFFTIEEVAEFLSLSMRSVRRLIEHHQLPMHRFGGAVRIAETDLRAYVATHRE